MRDILDFYGRCTRRTVSKSSDNAKAGAELSGNLRLPRKTHIPYRRGSEYLSGMVLYARHPRFLRKTHTTNRKSSVNAKAGNLRLSRKTHIPYRKSSERVRGKVLHAIHPRFLRKMHTTYRKSPKMQKPEPS